MTTTPHENWAEGSAYEQFMGRWSVEVAALFLEWLQINPHASWFDIGCGTGALTRSICQTTNPHLLVGADPSLSFVTYAKQGLANTSFITATGGALPIMNETFDVVVSGLALNFMSAPEIAVREMRRIVNKKGIVAAYVWDYAGEMEFLRYFWDVAVSLDATAIARHEGNRFPICQPEPLRQLWKNAGLKQVEVTSLEISTVFEHFTAYWESFTVGNFPAPQYVMSLDESHRRILRDKLQQTIPCADDGSLQLVARVWAIRGTR